MPELEQAVDFVIRYIGGMLLLSIVHIAWILLIVSAFCFVSWVKGNGWKM